MAGETSVSAAELARRLGGAFEGEGERRVCRVATLEQAGADALSWVGSSGHAAKLASTRAGVVLVPLDCQADEPTSAARTLIRVADPDVAMCAALAVFAPPVATVADGVDARAIVHETAVVDGAAIGANVYVGPGAKVGPGSRLHPGVYVGDEATIGRDCVLWPNVVVRERVRIGDRVVAHPNVTIGADGFGYVQRGGEHHKVPQIGTVLIEDDVEIGAGSTIDRARSDVTRIGRGTKIDNLVQIGHNVDIGEHCIIVALCGIGGSATVGDHAMLSGQVAVVDHVRIGRRVQVAAKSLVSRDIPDDAVVRGIPAIENARFLREQASVRRLPAWIERMRAALRDGDQAKPT